MPLDKTIYNYSSYTKEYLPPPGEGDIYPEDPNTVVIPANATQIAPPSTGTNQVAVFDPQASPPTWSVQQDYRGQTRYYTGENNTTPGLEFTVMDIGPLPANSTDQPRPTVNHVWNSSENEWELDTSLEDAAHNAVVLAELKEIDIRSIAPIRAWLAAQSGISQAVIDIEAEAVAKRAELRD